MRVERIATLNGINDFRLISESEDDAFYIRQIASAGTLTCISGSASSDAVFRAISVNASSSPRVISRGEIGKYNFHVRQNQSEQISLSFVRNEIPMDLSLYSNIKIQIKPERESGAVIELTLQSGLSVSGDSNNMLNINLTALQTAVLCRQQYFYDVLFENGALKNYMLEGVIFINKTTTR